MTIVYLLLCSLLVWRHPWFRSIGLSPVWRQLFFALHVGAAMAYGWLHSELYQGGDTFNMYHTGVAMADILWQDPTAFLHAFIGPLGTGIPPTLAPYPDALDYWHHYSSYSMVRLHALFHVLTPGGGYYAHTVLLAFALFWGYAFLLKSFLQFRQGTPNWIAVWLLGPPTVLFFGNGLHKESIVILALSLLFARLLRPRLQISFHSLAWVVAPLVLIFFVKEFYLVALIVPWLVYASSQQRPGWKPLWSVGVNLIIWAVVGWISWQWWDAGIWHRLESKQTLFLALQGDSNVFQHTFSSPLDLPKVILQGLINTLLLPTPGNWHHFPLTVYGLENYLLIGLAGYTFTTKTLLRTDQHRLVLLGSFFLISIIIIGIVVPNLGAIARYKAPALFGLWIAISLYWFPEKRKI